MVGEWELLATRPGGTVTSLATAGSVVLATTPAGLRRSTDGGRSWTVLGREAAPSIELAVPSPAFASDATVLAGTADGLLCSLDGGQRWQPVLVGNRVLAVAFSPSFVADGVVLVGTEQDGILRSGDRGQTWTSANPGLLDLAVAGLACSSGFEVDHVVFAATASGLFRSGNAGRSWRALEAVPGEPTVQCVALSPGFATRPVVLAGTETDGLLRSADGGTSWHALDALERRSVTALAWSTSGTLAAATDVGVFASEDAGETWCRVGPELGPVLSVAFTPDGAMLAGLPRLGVLRSSDRVNWERASTGLQANLVVALAPSPDFERDRTLFAAGLEDGAIVSTDAGVTWDLANGGLLGDPAIFGLAAGVDSTYAATSAGIFRRRGASGDWQHVHQVGARAVRADGQRVVAVGQADGMVASADGGDAWRPLAWPLSGGQPRSVALTRPRTILAGSSDATTARVAVWRSTSDGEEWRRVLLQPGSGGVPLAVPSTHAIDGALFAGVDGAIVRPMRDVEEVVRGERRPVWRRTSVAGSVSVLEASPAYAMDRTLVVGTSAGVYLSRDAGTTLKTPNGGPGDNPIVAAAFSPAYAKDRLIYVVELGGRIWRLRDMRGSGVG